MEANSDPQELRSNIQINCSAKCSQYIEHGAGGPSIPMKWCFYLTDYRQASKAACPIAKYLPVQCPVFNCLTLCDLELGMPGVDQCATHDAILSGVQCTDNALGPEIPKYLGGNALPLRNYISTVAKHPRKSHHTG